MNTHPALSRRALLGAAVGALVPLTACSPREAGAGAAVARSTPPAGAATPVALNAEVWKSPTCGCCKAWVKHLEANGFAVTAHDVADTAAMRKQLGMPANLGSCHSARIGGYAVEGHVPASDIKRLLTEKLHAVGLSVPGMPIGSPGMEQGGQKDKYQVLLVLHDGTTRIFQSHS